MLNKKLKVNFEYKDYSITAMGTVLSQALVVRLNLYIHDVEECDYPEYQEMRYIKELAREYLVDKAYYPEVEF